MNIREMLWPDKLEADEIYSKYFSHNEYPDFLDKNEFRCPFVVYDEDRIVLAGGVKTIAEAVVITDQSLSPRMRQEALFQALGSTIHIAMAMGHEEVYAFVNNDENYVKHLQKFGFRLIDAKLLVLDFKEKNG